MLNVSPRLRAAIRSSYSVAVGGASGTLLTFFQSNADLSRLDYHKVAQTAIGGALIALLFHWHQPPNAPTPNPH